MNGGTANVAERELPVTAGSCGLTQAAGQPALPYPSRSLTFRDCGLLQVPMA